MNATQWDILNVLVSLDNMGEARYLSKVYPMKNSWPRNGLRYCIWTDWKKPERKRKNLIRLGVDLDHAYAWSRTRKGGWAVAQSPILNSTITLKRLQQRGCQAMLKLYMELPPSIYEPPYTRPAWFILSGAEGCGGVLMQFI